ncbi:hypothetical protein DPEC_G00361410 [Dallia pectoralis]|uniref:Uncharacterized protein n=1 Tax=Dallia pectoralis TaxID=75939 RepID=A0ACC2F135_DALPE|nr:hypothetical protein DPEC_G00361410 [Dallia pectoralis]
MMALERLAHTWPLPATEPRATPDAGGLRSRVQDPESGVAETGAARQSSADANDPREAGGSRESSLFFCEGQGALEMGSPRERGPSPLERLRGSGGVR